MRTFQKLLLALVLGIVFPFLASGQPIDTTAFNRPIKVACIGNSITFGFGIKDPQTNSYPAQLAKMLGPKWEVKNFGISARTLLSKGDLPYVKEKFYKEAQEWLPDVVIVKLGTNDTKPWNWKYMGEFETDYSNFLAPFKALTPIPRIFICQAVPVARDRWGINEDTVKNQLNPLIVKIAEKEKVACIDLYTPLSEKKNLFTDGIHPNIEGAGIIAKEVYKALTGKKD
jgi:lysophospholipase L1-like esterase